MEREVKSEPNAPIELNEPKSDKNESDTERATSVTDLSLLKPLLDLGPLAVAVLALTYATGWMGIQFAHNAAGIHGLEVRREAAITCGVLFWASSLFILAPLASLAAGRVTEALKSLLLLLVVAICSILLSTGLTIQSQSMSAWMAYYQSLLPPTSPLLAVIIVQALVVTYLKSKAVRTVKSVLQDDSKWEWGDFNAQQRGAIRGAVQELLIPQMERAIRQARVSLSVIRIVAAIIALYLAVQMVSQFGASVLPTLKPSFGGYIRKQVTIELTEPRESWSGQVILQDSEWIVLIVSDGPMQQIPVRRIVSISSSTPDMMRE